LAAWFVLVIALFAVSSAALLWWRTRRARTYIAVPGRMVERSLAGAFVDGVPVGRYYTPRVKYAYEVDGKEFASDRFAFFQRHLRYPKAQEELAKLPDELTVYVDPRNPAEAVIERGGTGLAIGAGVIGVVLLLVALLAFNV
jgi:hypothetical protein